MNTDNKVHIGERDTSPSKPVSGGVLEPANSMHYPSLPSNGSPRARSRFSESFKDTVLSDNVGAADNTGLGAADGSEAVTSRSGRQIPTRSPKVSAGPSAYQGLPDVSSQSSDGTTRGQTADNRQQRTTKGVGDENAESWESVSPRKHISQRRRTADAVAERGAKQGTLYDFPAHTNSFASLEEEAREDELVEELCSDTQEEGDGSFFEGSFLGGTSEWVREKVSAMYDSVAEHPGRAVAVAGLTAVGVLVFMRRRRFWR